MAVTANKVIAPTAYLHYPVLDTHRDAYRLLRAEVCRVPLLDLFALNTLAIEVLLKVALAMSQRKCHQGNSLVGGGTQRIAGENAKTARIGGHTWIDRDLHGEVGDNTCGWKWFVGKGSG